MNNQRIIDKLTNIEVRTLLCELLSFTETNLFVVPDPIHKHISIMASSEQCGTATMINEPTKFQSYFVSCDSTTTEKLGFVVEATSAEEAIELCRRRIDINGDMIIETDRSFSETVSETNWTSQLQQPVYNEPPCPPTSNPMTS